MIMLKYNVKRYKKINFSPKAATECKIGWSLTALSTQFRSYRAFKLKS